MIQEITIAELYKILKEKHDAINVTKVNESFALKFYHTKRASFVFDGRFWLSRAVEPPAVVRVQLTTTRKIKGRVFFDNREFAHDKKCVWNKYNNTVKLGRTEYKVNVVFECALI